MEILIIIGIIVTFVIIRHLVIQGKVGEEISTGLDQRIRMNEVRAEMAQKTGDVDNKKFQEIMENTEMGKPDTLGLMESILTELGCQPQRDGESSLEVAYQGENFVINTGGLYAQIWDPGWASISVNDPNYEKMKTAANMSNFDFGPTIIYTSPNEDGMVWLHTKQDIVLFPTIPDRNEYVRAVFRSFFEKKEKMRGQFHSLITQQQQPAKPHRPVGFATESEEK